MARRGYKTLKVPLKASELTIYASPRMSDALKEITKDLSLYHGVRFTQILEVIYKQGKKDGAASAFDEITKGIRQAKSAVPHKRPGRPRKK